MNRQAIKIQNTANWLQQRPRDQFVRVANVREGKMSNCSKMAGCAKMSGCGKMVGCTGNGRLCRMTNLKLISLENAGMNFQNKILEFQDISKFQGIPNSIMEFPE
ncbi:hypothetical protein Nepgr_014006 [Nepenthes gracilis]|uniref:Uncharacterized protein n=1 Tax=Nepenthes gracilis TaxID=150966 RepID=A0AAD3XPZ3_NEPGR|nr:hypothetical protein Nepgr_014006 [Nepenthes gracilis]